MLWRCWDWEVWSNGLNIGSQVERMLWQMLWHFDRGLPANKQTNFFFSFKIAIALMKMTNRNNQLRFSNTLKHVHFDNALTEPNRHWRGTHDYTELGKCTSGLRLNWLAYYGQIANIFYFSSKTGRSKIETVKVPASTSWYSGTPI